GSFEDNPLGFAKNELLDMPLPFTGGLEEVNVGAISGKHYGPIYIVNAGFHTGVDKKDSGLDYNEYYSEIAKFMPPWSAIYFAHKYEDFRRRTGVAAPPTIVHNGEIMHFVVEEH